MSKLQAMGYQRCGNWTLGQICHHLAIFMRGSLDGFSWKIPWIFRVTIGRLFSWDASAVKEDGGGC